MCAKFVEQVKNAGQDPPEWLVQMAVGGDDFATDNTTRNVRDDRMPAQSGGGDDW